MNNDELVSDALNQPLPEEEGFEEAVDQVFAEQAEPPSEPTAEEPETAEAGQATSEEVEPDPSTPSEPPPPSDEWIEIGEHRIPRGQAETVANFYNWSQTPDGQRWVAAWDRYFEAKDSTEILGLLGTQPTPQAPPQPQEQAYQPEDEYVDPAVKALRAQMQAQQTELDQLRSSFETQRASTAQAMISRASSSFAQDHGLSPEETTQLVSYMDQTTNLSGFAVDSEGRPRDGISTLTAAMESAYWSIPEFRQKELERVAVEQKEHQKKSRKLAAVGGTSGSVPHKPPAASPEDREQAAYEMLSEAMGFKG